MGWVMDQCIQVLVSCFEGRLESYKTSTLPEPH